MAMVVEFARDVWSRSAEQIRRADPLLMGAAIAYNSLFALVPLALAFAALLTFFDPSNQILTDLYAAMETTLPPEIAAFLIDILTQSVVWVQDEAGYILVLSLLVALWSGSRAVYAVQKALRAVEGERDERGYLRSRLLGVAVTVVGGIGILGAYAVGLLGNRIWSGIADLIGVGGTGMAQLIVAVIAVAFVWFLLWAIYHWGPPQPMAHAGVVAGIVAGLVVFGTLLAARLSPEIGSGTIAVLGTAGVFLVWLYYIGVVVVAAPTVIAAFAGAFGDLDLR
jgi:membrane protein